MQKTIYTIGSNSKSPNQTRNISYLKYCMSLNPMYSYFKNVIMQYKKNTLKITLFTQLISTLSYFVKLSSCEAIDETFILKILDCGWIMITNLNVICCNWQILPPRYSYIKQSLINCISFKLQIVYVYNWNYTVWLILIAITDNSFE